MSSSKLVLFDLPSKGRCACWSLNPWKSVFHYPSFSLNAALTLKARLALNFKGIEYETEWVEYPDVEPKLKSLYFPPLPRLFSTNFHSVAANDASRNPIPYSIPTVQFPSGEYIMDSKAIAERLEKDYPSSPMHLDSHILRDVERLVSKQQETLRGVWMPDVPANLLNPVSAEYFDTTRSKRFGKVSYQCVSPPSMY